MFYITLCRANKYTLCKLFRVKHDAGFRPQNGFTLLKHRDLLREIEKETQYLPQQSE